MRLLTVCCIYALILPQILGQDGKIRRICHLLKGIPFDQKRAYTGNSERIYTSQLHDRSDKISTSIVWLLVHAFETSHTLQDSQFREFFNRILYWLGMSRAIIAVFSSDKLHKSYEELGEGFPGLFSTIDLKEPWEMPNQLKVLWEYSFNWRDGEIRPSYYGGIIYNGDKAIVHSRAHVSSISLEHFRNVF